MNKEEKLQKKIFLTGTIEALTGLHIGGTNQQMGIGGPDKLVIRNPLTQLPIIPGSSLKGKMRALLELVKGAYNKSSDKFGEVGSDPEITKLFGTPATGDNPHASRLIVRDAELANISDPGWENTDMLYSEAKTEVSINRLTSKANPRTFERVPAGAEFKYQMVVNVVAEDEQVENVENDLLKLLALGMELVEKDYLGGQGSRGYGQIKFKNTKITQIDYRTENPQCQDVDEKVKEIFSRFLK